MYCSVEKRKDKKKINEVEIILWKREIIYFVYNLIFD
jgi:hypothetical protein